MNKSIHPAPRHSGLLPQGMAGLSLIELIIFIVIIAIVTSGVMAGFNRMLTGSTTARQLNQAAYLAQQRMELILPQRQQQGFLSLTTTDFDPCTASIPSTQAICTAPTGYTITTTLTSDWLGNTDFKVIDVSVSGTGSAQLQALIGNY